MASIAIARPRPGAVAAAGIAALVVGWPLARLVDVVASDPAGLHKAVTSPGFAHAVAHTVVTAVGVTALAVPAGALLAVLTARKSLPGRRILQAAILLPLLVPPFVLGYSWTQAYGEAGFSDRFLGVTMPGLFGPVGIIVVGAATSVPLCCLIVRAAMATRDEPDLEQAAHVFGASALTAFRTVTLPLLRAPLGAASALVFVSALEAFAVPAALGIPAGYDTMTTRIYRDLALSSDSASFTQAIALSLGLVVLAAVAIWPADRLFKSRRAATRSNDPATSSTGRTTPIDRLGAIAAWCYIGLAILVPLAALLLAALTPAVGASAAPADWTLANFRAALAGPTADALRHSVILAAATAVTVVVLGSLVAVLERGRRSAGLGTLVTLGYALPGSALAVGVMLAFGRQIGGTLTIIWLAYVAKLWPLGHRPLSAAMDRLDRDHEGAARVSGASLADAWRTVVAPRLLPALSGAGLLVFVTALHEVTMSSLLYGQSSQTLAVVVLNAEQLGGVGTTAALSAVLTALVLLLAAAALIGFTLRRKRIHAPIAADATPALELADVV